MTQLPSFGESTGARPPATITADIQRAMVRDVLRTYLVGWSWIVLGILAGALIAFMLITGIVDGDIPSFIFAGGLLLAAILFVVLLRSALGKSIRAAYPVGAAATAFLTDDGLNSTSALGVGEIKFTAFREAVATYDTIVLKMAARASGMTALPRATLSDVDVERLRLEVTRASLARKGASPASN